ncbi:MAG: hypothetical protein IKH54_00065 [Bacilli bacterium]|nr:hypothetical protein [Bacilli bacterium]
MKKVKYLFLILLTLLVLPFTVFAEEEDVATEEDDKEVIVYFFRGEGCSHCAEAEAWFESIEEELGSKFKIVDYETWYNEDNADLMTKVAKARGEEETATGVPYIIIGDASWVGFDKSYESEMTDKINEMYEQEVSKRYNIMDFLDSGDTDTKNNTGNDILSLVIILLVCGGIGTGVYFARKQNA